MTLQNKKIWTLYRIERKQNLQKGSAHRVTKKTVNRKTDVTMGMHVVEAEVPALVHITRLYVMIEKTEKGINK